MTAAAALRIVVAMTADPGLAGLWNSAPHVYGAALAVSADEGAAAGVAGRVLRRAVGERDTAADRRLLVERAIRLGSRSAPGPGFAAMHVDDREAVALARLGGYSVAEIATRLGTSSVDVKARMLRGLQSAARSQGLIADSGRRTPPPPRDFESAASPARGARGS